MSYRLGVDLGTTFTAAAVANGMPPTMVGLGNRALQIPSVLFLAEDGTFLFGEAAERRGLAEPDRLVREFKRRIGDTVPVLIAGSPFSPQSLTARLLEHVVHTVTVRMGEPPAAVVLTHPANWGPYKLDLLRQAARLAGVERAALCPEPVAAATQYAARNRVAVGDTIAVYDLGGGTFDACVLEKTATGFALLGTPEGIEHLGGIDFDEALFQHVLGLLGDRLGRLDPDDPAALAGLARLRRECVDAKEALSADTETMIAVALPGVSTTLRLTRNEFEGLIRPALDDTLGALRRAVRSADRTPEQLRAIVLVGGSSRIPLIGELLQSTFPIPTALDVHPKHDIALGAVQARLEEAPSAGGSPGGVPTAPIGQVPPVAPPVVAPGAATARGLDQEAPTRPTAAGPAVGGSTVVEPPSSGVTPAQPPAAGGPEAGPETPGREPARVVGSAPAASGGRSSGPSAGSPDRSARRRQVILGAGAAAAVVGLALSAVLWGPWGSDEQPAGPSGPGGSGSSPSSTAAAPRGPATPAGLPRSEPLKETEMLVQMTTNGREAIWVGDTENPKPVRMLTTGDGSSRAMDISPAFDSMIYVHTQDDAGDLLYAAGVQRLEGAGSLFPRPEGCTSLERPAWNPVHPAMLAVPCLDSNKRYTIRLMTVEGDVLDTVEPPSGRQRLGDVVFTADGTKIAFWAAPKADKLDGGVLYTVEVNGRGRTTGKPRVLIPGDPGQIEGRDADPAFSPDGQFVAFRRRVPVGGRTSQADIYRVKVDGTGLANLTRDAADQQNPSWSPDSQQIAYKSKSRIPGLANTSIHRIWTMTAEGEDQEVLWPDGSLSEQALVAWAPR